MFEITFQGEATHRKERTKAPSKAMGTPVPLECDLDRCSLESTRKHLDSLESSDSPPPARDGVTQNGAEGNPEKEGDSHRLPPPRALCPSMRRGSVLGVSQCKAFPMVPIIHLLPSHPPRKELAAAPMAQRVAICQKGCMYRAPIAPASAGAYLGSSSQTWGPKQTDVLWVLRNSFLPSGLPRGAILPPSVLFRAGDPLHELPAPSPFPSRCQRSTPPFHPAHCHVPPKIWSTWIA